MCQIPGGDGAGRKKKNKNYPPALDFPSICPLRMSAAVTAAEEDGSRIFVKRDY